MSLSEEPESQFEKQYEQGWQLMHKPKEMAERVFDLLLGGFACGTAAPTEIWGVPTIC